jgi:hypothetical protein
MSGKIAGVSQLGMCMCTGEEGDGEYGSAGAVDGGERYVVIVHTMFSINAF